MKSFKFILRVLLTSICLYLLWMTLTFFHYRPYKLTQDYYYIGKGKEYSIKKGLFSSALITGKTSGAEWMISDQYIYGCNKATTNAEYDVIEYYIIYRKKGTVQFFDNSRELNRQLTEKGLTKIQHVRF
jgi:hypothetical protein